MTAPVGGLMGFVHYSEAFLFSNCHSPIALYFIRLTNMRTRLSVLGKRRIKSELFMKSVCIAKQTRWNHSCSENCVQDIFCVIKQPNGSMALSEATSEKIHGSTTKLVAGKRLLWRGTVTLHSSLLDQEDQYQNCGEVLHFKGLLHLHAMPCAGCNPTTLIPNVYQDLPQLLRDRGYHRELLFLKMHMECTPCTADGTSKINQSRGRLLVLALSVSCHPSHWACDFWWNWRIQLATAQRRQTHSGLVITTGEVKRCKVICKTYLSPLLLDMPTSFSMPPASRKALAFSMFLVMTSCRVQQMAVTVSSDMALLAELLLLLAPGSRWTRSLMAYLPLLKENEGRIQKIQQ